MTLTPEVDPDNSELVYIDFSGLSAPIKAILKEMINYQATVDDGEGGTMDNPIPWALALVNDGQMTRKQQVLDFMIQKGKASVEATFATIESSL